MGKEGSEVQERLGTNRNYIIDDEGLPREVKNRH